MFQPPIELDRQESLLHLCGPDGFRPPLSRGMPLPPMSVVATLGTETIARSFSGKTSPSELQEAADVYIASRLVEIAGRVSDTEVRARYSDTGLPLRERMGVLNYASSQDLIALLTEVCRVGQERADVRAVLEGKLDNILIYTNLEEKKQVLRGLLRDTQSTARDRYVGQLLHGSESMDELTELVRASDWRSLLTSENHLVREATVLGLIHPELMTHRLPGQLDSGASERRILDALGRVERVLRDQRRVIEKLSPQALGTDTAKEYLATIAYDEAQVVMLRDVVRREVAGAREHVNALILKIGIETAYGLKLSHESSGSLDGSARWSPSELTELKRALERMPLTAVLFAPNLHEIMRVRTIAPFVLGARYASGIIRIADYAVGQPSVDAIYPGVGSLQVTLTHEIGHGIQLGGEGGGFLEAPDGDLAFSPGQVRYDFLEWCSVSGWEVIAPTRFTLNSTGVVLDGQEVKLEQPVELGGRKVVLSYRWGVLFSRNADAEFTVDDYAKTNPWEDWAEAWTEYCIRPNRMKAWAPEKYAFFEQEFGKYDVKRR